MTRFLLALGFVLATAYLPALGMRDAKLAGCPTPPKSGDTGAAPQERVRISGRVRLVGNMPFPQLVISDEEHDWYLEQADRTLLEGYEQRAVTVEGRQEYHDLILANGEKIGNRRLLRDITIVSP